MKTRWAYDIPVHGVSEKYLSMKDLMQAYYSCRGNDTTTAQAMLEYGCDCDYPPAKLEMAHLIMTNPAVTLHQRDKYIMAEKLLSELANDLDISNRYAAHVALEMAKLYEILNRPVGMLAMLLRARRLGNTQVHDRDLDLCKRRLKRMDIREYGAHPDDAYNLGTELFYADGPFRFTELFLREAVDAATGELKGRSCLALADLYACNPQEGRMLAEEAFKLYREAEKNGFPDCLVRNTDPKRSHCA